MRTLLVSVTAVAALAATALPAASLTKPALRLLDRDPVVVRGTAFAPRERVVVSAFTPSRTIVRRLVTTRLGTFTVRFDTALGACTGIRAVRAVGARSGTATVRVLPTTRECPPPAP